MEKWVGKETRKKKPAGKIPLGTKFLLTFLLLREKTNRLKHAPTYKMVQTPVLQTANSQYVLGEHAYKVQKSNQNSDPYSQTTVNAQAI